MDRARPERLRRTPRLFAVAVAVCIGLGFVLRVETLQGTFFGDDWDHYAMYAGIYPVKRGFLDCFNFVGGHSERSDLMRAGRLPWWTSPEIRLAVLRPFASALTWFDFAVLNAQEYPWRARLHSLIWWIALIAGGAALLARVLPPPTAAVAIAFYAVHKSHALPLTWNANRSELVALACIYWATWAHLRSRVGQGSCFRLISIMLVALGMLAGEHALPPLTYLVMSELHGLTERARSIVKALAPFALIIFGFLLVRHALGYGLRASSFYVDPFAEPVRFAAATVERFPLMMGDVALGLSGDWFYVGAPWRESLIELDLVPRAWLSTERLGVLQQAIGWLVFAIVVAAITKLRRSPLPAHRALSWLLVAALLSLILGCGTLAFSRMTMAGGLGFCALWGTTGSRLWQRLRESQSFRAHSLSVLALIALLAIHVVHAAYRTHHETVYFAGSSRRELATALDADLPHDLHLSHVFVIRAVDWLTQFALPFAQHMYGRSTPATIDTLLPLSLAPIELRRVSSRVLDVSTAATSEGFSFDRSVYAREDVSFRRGQRVAGSRFTIDVAEDNAGKPTRLRFTFRHDLDDERYVFLYPFTSGLRRLTLPPIAASYTLPAPVAPGLGAPQ